MYHNIMNFQVLSWESGDVYNEDGEESFRITLFGRDASGNSVACHAYFEPYFFIEIPNTWQKHNVTNAIYEKIPRHFHGSIVDIGIVARKKLYGFTNNESSSDLASSDPALYPASSQSSSESTGSTSFMNSDAVVQRGINALSGTVIDFNNTMIALQNRLDNYLASYPASSQSSSDPASSESAGSTCFMNSGAVVQRGINALSDTVTNFNNRMIALQNRLETL
jgi:hypothetical protein